MKEITLPDRLIDMFENDPLVGWGVKDKLSRFVYVNNTLKAGRRYQPDLIMKAATSETCLFRWQSLLTCSASRKEK